MKNTLTASNWIPERYPAKPSQKHDRSKKEVVPTENLEDSDRYTRGQNRAWISVWTGLAISIWTTDWTGISRHCYLLVASRSFFA